MGFRVVDAHQHFWEPGRFDYPWMNSKVQPLIRPFLPEHLKPLLSQAKVDCTVIVQAISSMAEARWLLDLASANAWIAGVVAWVDLTNPNLATDLDELQAHPKFKGIRHQIEGEPDDAWMVREDALCGLSELERRDIPFDLLVTPHHLKHVARVRDFCPHLKLIVNHLAKPCIAAREFEFWAREIESVSRLPYIWCKLSGMITEANHKSWTAADLQPYVDHIIKTFGRSRVMFGSDWPVCTLAGSYQQVVETLRQNTGPLSETEAAMLWGDTASEVYRLDFSK
jgi:L-fucono-1,5-lactonase